MQVVARTSLTYEGGIRHYGRKQNKHQNRGATSPRRPPRQRQAAGQWRRRNAKAARESVIVEDYITVRNLATLMDRSPIDLIKVLMQYGIMAPITHSIDHDTAVILGEELGIAVEWPERGGAGGREEEAEEEPKRPAVRASSTRSSPKKKKRTSSSARLWSPCSATSTTARRRCSTTSATRTWQAARPAASPSAPAPTRSPYNDRKITFLDTPGHEAFTAMRARGAQVTDIVVLVVAADDGVMPQTREAISHARAAGVIIIVALNKIDRPNANPDRVMEELAHEGLQPEAWGGDTIVVPVSAIQGIGVDDLLENILVVAELEQFRSNPKGHCVGTVVESELDRYRGVTATLLVQNGTLKRGDAIVVGSTWGRLKAMFDYEGNALKEAGPSTPVVVLGLNEVPLAGDVFEVMPTDREARRIAEDRADDAERAEAGPAQQQMSLEELFARFEGGETKTLNLIVRADMQGTLEPVLAQPERSGQ